MAGIFLGLEGVRNIEYFRYLDLKRARNWLFGFIREEINFYRGF